MKQNLIIKISAITLWCTVAALGTACSDEFHVGNAVNESKLAQAVQTTACIRNEAGHAGFTQLEIIDSTSTEANFYVNLTDSAAKPVVAQLTLADDKTVSAYNKAYGTSYVMYPTSLVKLSNDPMVLLTKDLLSTPVTLSVSPTPTVNNDTEYAIPLQVTTSEGKILNGDVHMVLVRDLRGKKLASAEKASGIKLFSCMEVGTANPLLHTSFMLKKSGKPLFDCVVLFSGYIVYDLDIQRVRFKPSTGISAIISNYDKYIKPLHDLGIKVIVSILGTNDGEKSAGVANLDDATAKYFAQDLADFCRAYKLDGVFFDDEYTGTCTKPGFVSHSSAAAARLCYETKMAMPDKWVVCYMYNCMYSFGTINNVQPGDYVDYALNDYGASLGTNYYPGMEKTQLGLYSTNWAPAYWRDYGTASYLQNLRSGGYGAYMGYCLDWQTTTWAKQLVQLNNIAKYLYDDELVDLGYRPKPEW